VSAAARPAPAAAAAAAAAGRERDDDASERGSSFPAALAAASAIAVVSADAPASARERVAHPDITNGARMPTARTARVRLRGDFNDRSPESTGGPAGRAKKGGRDEDRLRGRKFAA
jgi:hypothetical protein